MNWISVEDQMPENCSWNLIFTESMVTMAFFEEDENNNIYWLCHNDAQDKSEWNDVSHWMPLPAPPKEHSHA